MDLDFSLWPIFSGRFRIIRCGQALIGHVAARPKAQLSFLLAFLVFVSLSSSLSFG